jgi:hypothetical protein
MNCNGTAGPGLTVHVTLHMSEPEYYKDLLLLTWIIVFIWSPYLQILLTEFMSYILRSAAATGQKRNLYNI